MSQIVDLNPEQDTFRIVASHYADDAFRHGVFPEILDHQGREHLAWLEHYYKNEKPLQGEIPSRDFMTAVRQLDALGIFPKTVATASPEAIAKLLQKAGVIDEDRFDNGLEFYTPIFGEAPSEQSSYFIGRALLEIPHQVLEAHPATPFDGSPELFSTGLPFMQSSYMRYLSRARAQRLSHMKEYIEGTSKDDGVPTHIPTFFPPQAHEMVIQWNDQERLLAHFISSHGPLEETDQLDNVRVSLKHVDDIHNRTKKLTNTTVDEASRQIFQFVIDLTKIKDPTRY